MQSRRRGFCLNSILRSKNYVWWGTMQTCEVEWVMIELREIPFEPLKEEQDDEWIGGWKIGQCSQWIINNFFKTKRSNESWNKVYYNQQLFNVPNMQFHGTCCHYVFGNWRFYTQM